MEMGMLLHGLYEDSDHNKIAHLFAMILQKFEDLL